VDGRPIGEVALEGLLGRDRDPFAVELEVARVDPARTVAQQLPDLAGQNRSQSGVGEDGELADPLDACAREPLLGARLRGSGVAGRTVTTKLRYADFSIRSRSTTLAAAVDDDETIADLACALLDRGLRDRPGALRLLGIGVSGLSDHRQLSFDGAA